MSTASNKPLIFISYAHADEPDKPDEGEFQWLSFVRRYLQPALKDGIFDLWIDRRMMGGADWDPEIEQKIRACDIFILLVSANSMASDYIIDKEIAIIRARQKIGEDVHFYPLLLTPTPEAGLNKVKNKNLRPRDAMPFSAFSYHDRLQHMTEAANEIAQIAHEIAERRGAAQLSAPSERPAYAHVSSLPETGYERLVGREAELKRLDDAWVDRKINIISLIAEGGGGKSALINEWLKRLQDDNYRGAAAVLGWSFYSQGSKERATSTDEFLNWTLDKLGISGQTASASAKAEAIAEAMMRRRVLLLLDGIEPLQHGPNAQLGQLKDLALRALMRRFAATPWGQAHGLIVLTSRLAVKDIERWQDGAAPVVNVQRLSDESGAALLRDNGVWGTDKELKTAAHDFGGHPLALSLLASFLNETQTGDIRRRDHIRAVIGDSDNPHHDHAIRVMESYEKEWLIGQTLLQATMYMVGLFDRPAIGACVRVLRDWPFGLDDTIAAADDADWNRAVHRLREVRLLAPAEPSEPSTLDAHPMVRDWFGERFQHLSPELWRIAHEQIYEFLRDLANEGNTPTLEQLSPLLQAISHGCRSGHYSVVLQEIYKDRISRRRGPTHVYMHYISRILGAVSSDISALSWFFEKPYELLVEGLSKSDQSFVKRITFDRLRAQTRLTEALPLQYDQLDSLKVEFSTQNAGIKTGIKLSMLLTSIGRIELLLGNIEQAYQISVQSGELAEQITNSSTRRTALMIARYLQAETLHAKGDLIGAEHVFVSMKNDIMLRHPRFLLPHAYRDLLLQKLNWMAAFDQAKETLGMTSTLKTIGLESIIMCRSSLGVALSSLIGSGTIAVAPQIASLRNEFDAALGHLRAAEDLTAVPLGLLARSAFRRIVGDWDGAERDLDEVEEIAEPGPMRLFLCDMAIERARLALARVDAFAPFDGILCDCPPKPEPLEGNRLRDEAARQLAIAADHIENCGYHRRDEEIAEVKAVQRGERSFASLPARV